MSTDLISSRPLRHRTVPFIKHGRKILYAREEARAYIERNRRERTEPRKAASANNPVSRD